MFRGRHWYFPDVSCAHFHFSTAWELSEIVSTTPENNFYSRHIFFKYIFCIPFQRICVSLSLIYSDYWWFMPTQDSPVRTSRPKQRRLLITWPPESPFRRWDKYSQIKAFVPGECAHAALQLQLLFMHWCPYLNFRELPCRWIFWWRFLLMRWMKDQNNRGTCACEEAREMNEVCGDVCVPGRNKIKVIVRCMCVCEWERGGREREYELVSEKAVCGEWVTEEGGNQPPAAMTGFDLHCSLSRSLSLLPLPLPPSPLPPLFRLPFPALW